MEYGDLLGLKYQLQTDEMVVSVGVLKLPKKMLECPRSIVTSSKNRSMVVNGEV